MVLSCINTNRIGLSYEIGGVRNIVSLATQYSSNGSARYSIITIGKIGENLSYEIVEDKSKRKYMAMGTSVNTSAAYAGETLYYIHLGVPDEELEYFRIKDVYGYFYAEAKLKDDGSGRNLYRNGYVNQISEWGYQQNLTENIDTPKGNSGQKITIDYGEPIYTKAATKSLSSYQLYRYGSSTYIVKVYNDSKEIALYSTSLWHNTRYTPEPDLVKKSEQEIKQTKYSYFNKKIGTQGVEVLQVPGSPHKKVLWLVDIDEEGIELKRESLFEFEVLPSQGTPSHRIDCLEAVVTECPENTCEVICGEIICCYNSNGISVLNFPANT